MTEQLAESFRIETFFNADCCIGMSQKMKVDISDSAFFKNRLESVLHSSWFSWLTFTCDNVEITTAPVISEDI